MRISFKLLAVCSGSALLVNNYYFFVRTQTHNAPKNVIVSALVNQTHNSLHTLDKTNKLKRHVILLGPHERFNFGDLLFEKVLSKLLMTKLGYEDHEIIRAGTIPINMTVHGGYHNIVSMKQAQNMSRTSPHGPFDIIYTGGQTLGCRYMGAVKMLATPELRALGRKEKVYDCAYLFPKELLLPLNDKGEPDKTLKNIAIANSPGGYPGKAECSNVADAADYKAYRDLAPLAPDCAVMVKELYGDLVSSNLKDVRKSLFPQDEDRKYIAVQFKKGSDVKLLPGVLDNIATKTDCTIVFFAAGTVPNHDSLDLYRNVTEQMKEPAIVYEGEDVWKTVALISGAEAVFSTSLHVRIMSFIYMKPRVTWCPSFKSKHREFINLWDAPNMRVCGEVSTTWSILNQYWGETPAITQEETALYYEKTVLKYMESFRKWGGLLDLFNKIEQEE